MKKFVLIIGLFLAFFVVNKSFAQTIDKADSLGLPGDNLNLYAVLDLFQNSETFEEFEKKLNQEDFKINNLDLNNDNKIDYIKVIDNKTGDNHAIVLQTPINAKENQDIAVIEIEKTKDGKILLQIVGNEDLYGKDYIIEPQENDPDKKEALTKNPAIKSDTTIGADGKTVIVNNYYTTNNYNTTNNNSTVNSNRPDRVYVSVNYWPMVRYIYTPSYVVYVSPWYWYSYPAWWNPWNPWFWHNYYWHHHNHHHHYYGWYHRTPVYRTVNTHNYYGQRKSSSETVYQNRQKGTYIKTYDSPDRGKPNTPNPGYKPSNKPANNNSPDRVKSETAPANKPVTKPNYNNSARPETKPNYNKPQTKPQPNNNINNKPANKPNYNKPQNKPTTPAPIPQTKPNTTKPQHQGGQKGRQ
ncbi:MAG: hypothetical protein JNL69_08665 [Bacteroidia bacterium]|nr:hypothetical protein [Bacteroidia bacterium]